MAALASDTRGRNEGYTSSGVGEEPSNRQQWLTVRKEEALKIDPDRAEVYWQHGQILDPYGVEDLSDEEYCIGRNYFARSPGSDVWVSFHDLPEATCDDFRCEESIPF
jgi:hypothetical protein